MTVVTTNTRRDRRAAASTKRRRVMRLSGVMAATGWGKSTVWLKVAQGILPKPAHLFNSKIAIWDEDEIIALIDAAFAARDQQAAK
jgi:predicted DNA-binding transcriptional regulator AlpA